MYQFSEESCEIMNTVAKTTLLLCAVLLYPFSACAETVSYQKIIKRAQVLSEEPYQEPDNKTPDFLRNISYDQWRDIRFKDENTLWGEDESPFKIRFFHPGFFYHQPVVVNEVERVIKPFTFSPELFEYGHNDFQSQIPAGLGLAGFRIHYPVNNPSVYDEVAVFLGASYFRAVAKNQFYGMSARGLAVNTAIGDREEFPAFNEFWVIKPSKNDKKIKLYALLDSPSVVGAYEYIITPGNETVMVVKSTLFIRKKISKLGIAPLTSMFFSSESSKFEGHEDFRPEVHDSDGMAILTKTGEWIWRPVVNPKELLINSFDVGTPQGFGLFQRDQNFDHYQDLESRFESRPSVWVTPKADWGNGHVELLQIPTTNEYNDNINVYWVPEKAVEAGQRMEFSYTMSWGAASGRNPTLGYVTDTRIVRGDHDKERMRFFVDFQGKDLSKITADKALIADISVSRGYTILERQVFKNIVTGGWRLVFFVVSDRDFLKDMLAGKKPPVDLRAFLKNDTRAVTETWTYTYIP